MILHESFMYDSFTGFGSLKYSAIYLPFAISCLAVSISLVRYKQSRKGSLLAAAQLVLLLIAPVPIINFIFDPRIVKGHKVASRWLVYILPLMLTTMWRMVAIWRECVVDKELQLAEGEFLKRLLELPFSKEDPTHLRNTHGVLSGSLENTTTSSESPNDKSSKESIVHVTCGNFCEQHYPSSRSPPKKKHRSCKSTKGVQMYRGPLASEQPNYHFKIDWTLGDEWDSETNSDISMCSTPAYRIIKETGYNSSLPLLRLDRPSLSDDVAHALLSDMIRSKVSYSKLPV
ncbi:hypothetical protein DdX_13563 [Ditylenchus destructor]|uniref:Uncharacterized protein n=1 Tax=Ditylenchus destructor TaxID=166010 RepID=A0AAD4QWG6_9BILA|nr:hypothetical protein DdX_13563 [Ditylenchus destructor]